MGADKVSLSKVLKYLALLFVAATVFGEPEAEAVADPAADASADPYYLTYGLGHYGYAGYYGYPYGYGYWGRKRRSAEAEAAAAADPEADPRYRFRGFYGGRGRRYFGRVDSMEEKGDQQSLKQKPPLTPRLIPTCCMEEDIMDMG